MTPTWEASCDTCWYADTLGFLTGPSTQFTLNMQAVDEHGRVERAEVLAHVAESLADHRLGRQDLLIDVLAVLGGELELVRSGPDADGVQQRVLRVP